MYFWTLNGEDRKQKNVESFNIRIKQRHCQEKMPACKWQEERPRSWLTALHHLMEIHCKLLFPFEDIVRLPADEHGWWNSNEQESCVTHSSHLLESPFVWPQVFWAVPLSLYKDLEHCSILSRNTNLLLKQQTSYQNVTGTTSSKCPSKAVHSTIKIAKWKTTKANKSTCLAGEKHHHERSGVWVAPSACWSPWWIVHHQTHVEMVWIPQ